MTERGRGRAFGLAVEADFAIPALAGAGSAGLPGCRLRRASAGEIDDRWRIDGVRRVSESRSPDGEERAIDAHPALGYRLYARGYGLCELSADGSSMLCAAPPAASWRWERFLAGRCLPTAAMLSGYEVLHASAVALGGGAHAIVGPTGAGKTSLAVRLTLAGARFLTDDVLAVAARDGEVIAHPGLATANLRDAEVAQLAPADRDALGPLVPSGPGKRRCALPTAEPLPLRGVYFLVPEARRTRIDRLAEPEPLRLLASTFVSEARPPERVAGLLDACARLARDVPMFELVLGPEKDASEVAQLLAEHATVAASA